MRRCSASVSSITKPTELPRRARWLLATLDRFPEDRFSGAHAFLAMALGATSPSVSIVLKDIEQRGILRLERSNAWRLSIGDWTGLLEVACHRDDGIRGAHHRSEPAAGCKDSLKRLVYWRVSTYRRCRGVIHDHPCAASRLHRSILG